MLSTEAGAVPFCCLIWRRIASGAPLRICWPSGQVDAAHPRLGRERHEPRSCRNRGIAVGFPHVLSGGGADWAARLMEQLHDALALGRLVGGGGLGRQASDFGRREAVEGHELRRPAVADGDRSRLVQEQRVHVARHFHRFSALGHDVRSQGAVHAGDADGRQQGADGRGNQAHQQRHQRRHVGAEAQDAVLGAVKSFMYNSTL